MIRSNSGSPEVGMSAGIEKPGSGLAIASGASTRLNRKPVRLVKRKREKIANGANFNERKWGSVRGNFIQQYLHWFDDDHKRAPGLQMRRTLQGTALITSQNFNSKAVSKDQHSDGLSTIPVAHLFNFYVCKLLEMLYLFASLNSVDLKHIVML